MARIVANDKNFRETQRAHLKASLDTYKVFFNDLPLLVNYYSKSHAESTHDVNLGTVQEIVGDDSPVVFNLIKDLPLHKASNLDVNPEDSDDAGTEAQVEGTAIVSPSALMPREDDCFTIPWYGHKKAIFRVQNVKRSNIKGQSFYEITYYLYQVYSGTGDIDKQVARVFRVIASSHSVNKTAIVEDSKADICAAIEQKLDVLVDEVEMLYDLRTDAYMFPVMNGTYLLWDEALHYFASKANVFYRNFSFRQDRIPLKIDVRDYDELYRFYTHSLWWALEHHNFWHMGPYLGIYMITPYREEVPGRHLRDVYVRGAKYCASETVNPCMFGYQRVFGNLWEYLRDETDTIKFDVLDAYGYGLLLKFWFQEKRDIDKIPEIINKIIPAGLITDYYYLPAAIFMLKDLRESIMQTFDYKS